MIQPTKRDCVPLTNERSRSVDEDNINCEFTSFCDELRDRSGALLARDNWKKKVTCFEQHTPGTLSEH